MLTAVSPLRLATDVAWALVCARTGVREATLGDDVELRSAGRGKGLGVYARRRLEQGECLVRYTGALRALERHEAMAARGETGSEYAIRLGSEWVLDAEDADASSWARYINHSVRRENCKIAPCGLDAIAAQGVLPACREPFCIFVQATRAVAPGEELLLDYGREYWDVAAARRPEAWAGLGGALRRWKVDYW